MKISHLVAVGLGSAALIVVSSASAFAGEVTGKGTHTQGPAHSNSICVFSGLDTEDDNKPGGTEEPDPDGNYDDDAAERGNQSPGGVDRYHGVQSYGILVAYGIPKEFLPSPGMACNGHTGFLAGGE